MLMAAHLLPYTLGFFLTLERRNVQNKTRHKLMDSLVYIWVWQSLKPADELRILRTEVKKFLHTSQQWQINYKKTQTLTHK